MPRPILFLLDTWCLRHRAGRTREAILYSLTNILTAALYGLGRLEVSDLDFGFGGILRLGHGLMAISVEGGLQVQTGRRLGQLNQTRKSVIMRQRYKRRSLR
jgi:hypothetical protein